jgi:hypothetical protein
VARAARERAGAMRGDALKFRDRIPFRVQTQPDYGLARVHFTGVDDGAGMIVLRTTYPHYWHHMSP